MSASKVLESTLSLNFDESAYEDAHETPTLYRALRLEPRHQHPFWIYDSILKQCRLAGASLEIIPPIAEQMAAAFVAKGKKRILFSGIGASFHLAASAAHLFGEVTGLQADFIDSSEALLSDLPYEYADALVVGLSASGNTLEAVEHLRKARESGALTAAFVNLDHTRLVQESELPFVAPGGYGFLWDYTTRLAPLAYLATELALQRKSPVEPLVRLRDELLRLPPLMEQVVQSIDARCRTIGEYLLPLRAAVAPASGNLLPVAWELTLRFEEMAHFPARGRPTVDFLHGGVGHLAGDIAAVLLAAPGKTYPFSRRVAQVTQVLKTPCIAVVEENDTEIAPLADEVVRLPGTHPVLRPLVYLLPAQLIPYYLEVSRPGGNPDILRTDQPRYARAFDVAYPPRSH
jgi:glucosamine--fructose-6-phosphate aminotransferase (isomerizing)